LFPEIFKPKSQRCKPEDCLSFPELVSKDYVKRYYIHNVSLWIPCDFPSNLTELAVSFAGGGFEVGDRLDCADKQRKWYASTVREVGENDIFVHFEGWAEKWNEWIWMDDEKSIAPLNTKSL
jgi:hypothetical protein